MAAAQLYSYKTTNKSYYINGEKSQLRPWHLQRREQAVIDLLIIKSQIPLSINNPDLDVYGFNPGFTIVTLSDRNQT